MPGIPRLYAWSTQMSNSESRRPALGAGDQGTEEEWPEAGVLAAMQLVRSFCGDGTHVIDVGAHYGETLRSLFKAFPRPIRYVGFEPNPEAFTRFKAAAHGLTSKDCSLECLQAAAGPRNGTTKFLMTKESAV